MERAKTIIPHQPPYKHKEGEVEELWGPEGEEGWKRVMRDGQEFTSQSERGEALGKIIAEMIDWFLWFKEILNKHYRTPPPLPNKTCKHIHMLRYQWEGKIVMNFRRNKCQTLVLGEREDSKGPRRRKTIKSHLLTRSKMFPNEAHKSWRWGCCWIREKLWCMKCEIHW